MLEEELVRLVVVLAQDVGVGPDDPKGSFLRSLHCALMVHQTTQLDTESQRRSDELQVLSNLFGGQLRFEPLPLLFIVF